MRTKDHNETLAGIHLAFGAFLVLVVIIAPLLLERDLQRHTEQIPFVLGVWLLLLGLAVLMILTALAMSKKKPKGRNLALWAAPFLLLMFWFAGVYSGWFLHSNGAKQMFGVKEE